MSNTKTVEAGERTQRFTPGFALPALLGQMLSWSKTDDHINFGALTEHPKTSDECTVGDLIGPANKEAGKLISDRSELLEELRELTAFVRNYHNSTDAIGYLESAEAAISKAEKGAQ